MVACSHCIQNPNSKVIIATFSKVLQDQVLKEIDLLSKVVDMNKLKFMKVKGKGNYLHREKIVKRLKEQTLKMKNKF